MRFALRTSRHLVTLAWPALIAALVMLSFPTNGSMCPVEFERGECGQSTSWSSAADILNLVRVSDSRVNTLDAVREPPTDGRPVLGTSRPKPRHTAILGFAPKTSPPR